MTMFKRIDHFEIIPANPKATIRFYTEILGFRIAKRIPVAAPPLKEVVYLALGDSVLEIMAVDGPAPKSETPWQVGYRAIALEVEDMSQALVHLKQVGVAPTHPPADLGNSLRAEIQDPDGLVIELRQWKKPKTQE